MKVCARIDEVLIAGYFLNGLSILDMKFANLAPAWRHLLDGMTGDPPFLFRISKGDLTRIACAKFHGIPIMGYILNEL